jgi:hypothetical protein
MSERFAAKDVNKNGVLDRTEVERMPEEFFQRIDTDKSGGLSPAELANGRPHRGPKPDGNFGDQAVTKAEFVAKAKERAAKLDANKAAHGKFGRGRHGHGPHGHDAVDAEEE